MVKLSEKVNETSDGGSSGLHRRRLFNRGSVKESTKEQLEKVEKACPRGQTPEERLLLFQRKSRSTTNDPTPTPKSFIDTIHQETMRDLGMRVPETPRHEIDLDSIREEEIHREASAARAMVVNIAQRRFLSLRRFREQPDVFRWFRFNEENMKNNFVILRGASPGNLVISPSKVTTEEVTDSSDNMGTEVRVRLEDPTTTALNVHHGDDIDNISPTGGGRIVDLYQPSPAEVTVSIPSRKGRTIERFTIDVGELKEAMEVYVDSLQYREGLKKLYAVARETFDDIILSRVLIYVPRADIFLSVFSFPENAEKIKRNYSLAIKETRAYLSTLSGDVPEISRNSEVYRVYGVEDATPYYVLDNLGIHEIHPELDPGDEFVYHRDDCEGKVEQFDQSLRSAKNGTLPITKSDSATGATSIVCVVSRNRKSLEKVRDQGRIEVSLPTLEDYDRILADKDSQLNQQEAEIDGMSKKIDVQAEEIDLLKKEKKRWLSGHADKVLDHKVMQAVEATKQSKIKTNVEETKSEATIKSSEKSESIENYKLIGAIVAAGTAVTLAGVKIMSAVGASSKSLMLRKGVVDWMAVMSATKPSIGAGGMLATAATSGLASTPVLAGAAANYGIFGTVAGASVSLGMVGGLACVGYVTYELMRSVLGMGISGWMDTASVASAFAAAWVVRNIRSIGSTIASVASSLKDSVVSFFTESVPSWWDKAIKLGKGAIGWVKEKASSAWTWAKETASSVWDTVTSWF